MNSEDEYNYVNTDNVYERCEKQSIICESVRIARSHDHLTSISGHMGS